MGSTVAAPTPGSVVLLLMVALFATLSTTQAQLVTGFYQTSCPNAENVITSAVNSAFNIRAASAAGVLRIHFHDCFVKVNPLTATVSYSIALYM